MNATVFFPVLFLPLACMQAGPEAYDVYGEPANALAAIAVEAVVADSALYLGEVVGLVGTVHDVCQMKGCWLTLQGIEGEQVRVDVARTAAGDYAFTVPTGIGGRRAIARGVLRQDSMDAATRHHYQADAAGAMHPYGLSMVASGVMIASQ